MRNINRQLGIAFELILFGIAAVMVVGAIGTFAIQMRSAGKAAGIAQEQPKTEAATKRATAAELRSAELNAELDETIASNKRAIEQVEKFRLLLKEVQDEWGNLKARQAEQEEKTRAALATYAEREKRQTAEVRRLREIAASPVTITEGVLDEADVILRSTIRDILGLQ